ncbi:nuclease-related domain-containing protein [Streptomyces griseosporeus]|uniref:nuclease-related domain-containing protein n=1 Tax=Streptomyces griseosporeus TaxID=1910 RepID=UPI0036FADDC6
MGLNRAARRADALAARTRQGALGEQWTAGLLERLPAGWRVFHDLAVPGRRFNVDHLVVPPSGLGVIVLDSKKWHARYPTSVVRGRVHCGRQDRHEQVEALAGYASAVAARLGVPAAAVLPLMVVHGSPVVGGAVDVRVPAWEREVRVLGAELLAPTLLRMPGGRDPVRAAALARRVIERLPSA